MLLCKMSPLVVHPVLFCFSSVSFTGILFHPPLFQLPSPSPHFLSFLTLNVDITLSVSPPLLSHPPYNSCPPFPALMHVSFVSSFICHTSLSHYHFLSLFLQSIPFPGSATCSLALCCSASRLWGCDCGCCTCCCVSVGHIVSYYSSFVGAWRHSH